MQQDFYTETLKNKILTSFLYKKVQRHYSIFSLTTLSNVSIKIESTVGCFDYDLFLGNLKFLKVERILPF